MGYRDADFRDLNGRGFCRICFTLGSDDKATLHDLADEYDVSAERIRQIENAALKKSLKK